MQQPIFFRRLLVVLIASAISATPVLAGPGRDDDRRGRDEPRAEQHDRGHQQDDRGRRQDDRRPEPAQTRAPAPAPVRAQNAPRFDDHHREVASSYFADHYRHGTCPPGLAKRGDTCTPPGQRRWETGRPLPRDVVAYPLPKKFVVSLGTPPRGYRYVRVADDILMVAIGTGIVVDALQDLSR